MIARHTLIITLAGLLVVAVVFVAVEFAIITRSGNHVATPNIPRGVQILGAGPALSYVVMGDSTTIGQGAEYAQSYAWQSAEHLGKTHRVSLLNVGVSGARAADVASQQLSKAVAAKPDIVLLAVGANDVIHFTSGGSMERSLQTIISGLRAANPAVKIVVTGSPAMGSVARFPWPAKQLAGLRTRQINKVYARVVAQDHLVFAPIAAKTGAAFLADKTLFAADNFHPNARGYALWTPVVDQALDTAIRP